MDEMQHTRHLQAEARHMLTLLTERAPKTLTPQARERATAILACVDKLLQSGRADVILKERVCFLACVS